MDWLIPIIIIVVSIAQWISKTRRQQQEEEPPVLEPVEEEEGKVGGEWDELIKALGGEPQKKKEEEIPPVVARDVAPRPSAFPVDEPILPIPPKILKPTAPKKPKAASVPKPLAPQPRSLRPEEEKILQEIEKRPHAPLYQIPHLSSRRKKNILATLKDRGRIRDAILINEILAAPPGLRSLN